MSALIRLVRTVVAAGVDVQHIPVVCYQDGRTWLTSTRWVHLDEGMAVIRINYSSLPRHESLRYQIGAHWGFGEDRQYRLLSGWDLVEEAGALLAEILASPVDDPRTLPDPIGQLSMLDLLVGAR